MTEDQYHNLPQERIGEVETSLYNRMLRNAFVGFLKSSAIAATVGLAIGGLIASGFFGSGIITTLGLAHEGTTMGILMGGLKTALALGSVGGSIGAVAGIQSTRDTRRFLRLHESRSPEDVREAGIVLEPALPEKEPDHFQKKVCGCEHEQSAIHAR